MQAMTETDFIPIEMAWRMGHTVEYRWRMGTNTWFASADYFECPPGTRLALPHELKNYDFRLKPR